MRRRRGTRSRDGGNVTRHPHTSLGSATITDGLPARYELRDRVSASMLLRFEAEAAGLAGDGELVLATPASGAELDTNIFLVDVESATATFVASTQLGSRPLIVLSATDGFIARSHRFCTADATIQVFDRSRSTILEVVGVGWAELTPTNDLAIGEFGARSIVDLETGEFTTVLPGDQNEVNWSPDDRYASVGAQLEHGSRCP